MELKELSNLKESIKAILKKYLTQPNLYKFDTICIINKNYDNHFKRKRTPFHIESISQLLLMAIPRFLILEVYIDILLSKDRYFLSKKQKGFRDFLHTNEIVLLMQYI